MATPALLDFDRLLAPLSETGPCGDDPRQDTSPTSPFYRIKDAQARARNTERTRPDTTNPDANKREPEDKYFLESLGSWGQVAALADEMLRQRSKDLRVSAWYTEALVRLHRFAGLRDGFRLMRQLIEGFWDCLYPLPDEEGLSTRLAPLVGLMGEGGSLTAPISRVPLTQGAIPVSYWRWVHEYERPQKAEERSSGLARLERAVAETDIRFSEDLREDLDQCQEELAGLSRMLEERCGKETPSSSSIRDILIRCREVVRVLSKESTQLPKQAPEGNTPGPKTSDERLVSTGPRVETTAFSSREEAFSTVLRVADFLRRIEPHSPVSYLLEQAVRWGRMPLGDLLNELIPDEKARDTYRKLTGLRETTKAESK
jgi:type VI secretion system protein ImpA